jgi:biopolymer transport protein ExbD
MKLFRPRGRFKEIPAASMPDIAFLLIIFFLVSSVLVLKQGLIILLPKDQARPLVLAREDLIRVELLPAGRVLIDDNECSMAGITRLLRIIIFRGIKPVLLLIDPRCAHKHVVEAIGRIQEAGITMLSIKKRKAEDEDH